MIDILHQKPFLGRPINWAHPLAEGLIGCWIMNEGSGNKAFDLTKNKIDGTLINMEESDWIAEKDGFALDFDGTDEYIDCGTHPLFDISGSMLWSAEIWINTINDVIAGDGSLLLKIHESGNYGTWDKGIRLTDNEFAEVHVFDGASKDATGSTALNDGLWHQVVGTFTGPAIELYVDGILIAETAASGTFNFTTPVFDIAHDAAGASEYFQGKVELVRLYNIALSIHQVAWLYREPYTMFQQNRVRRFSVGAPPAASITVLAAAYMRSRMRLKGDWLGF